MSAIVVVMGVAGSGKTTIGRMIADAIPCTFLEGDTLHSRDNVDKMSRGIPLTDADRAPWLATIHARMADAHSHGESLVVGCSALKRRYRAVLADGLPVVFVYLKGSRELIQERMRHRVGHFMKAGMLASQFDALEEPEHAIVADVSGPPEVIVRRILSELTESGRTADRSRSG